MSQGGLIPFQLTVKVLVNALKANPAKVRPKLLFKLLVVFD